MRKDHPPTLPPTGADGLPVVVTSWEDEADEVHRRLQEQPVSVADLADRSGNRRDLPIIGSWTAGQSAKKGRRFPPCSGAGLPVWRFRRA